MFDKLMERKMVAWPPWGEYNVDAYDALAQQPGPPPDWMKWCSSAQRQTAQKTWGEFIAGGFDIITRALWPKFDVKAGDWPEGTLEHRKQITAADLSLMLAMQAERPEILMQPIQTPVCGPAPGSQLSFFEGEDNSVFGDRHIQYDATLPHELLVPMSAAMLEGFYNKSGTTAKQFKRHLQRPRAYQMAKAFGIPNFRYHFAASSDSASTISGHALAGMIMAGTIMDRWISAGGTVGGNSFIAMQQYAVDVGDRRVMTGVHYPSDNIASWIIALRIADYVFENPAEIKDNFWIAITMRSMVYDRIVNFKPSSVYCEGLKELHKLRPAYQPQ
jgi:hypothetical protein